MSVLRSLRTISQATGTEPIDWSAVETAAREAVPPGSLGLTAAQRRGYRDDVRDARRAVRTTSMLTFDVPHTIQVQNRHHWMDANLPTFQRLMQPLADRQLVVLPAPARVVNTGTMTLVLAFLGRHVLGQYDPLLLADEDTHELYFVHPNIVHAADELDVPFDRFRRWIAFHEVTHAAEFGAAPWLPDQLERHVRDGLDALSAGSINRTAFRELDATMTAVEGYAEWLMDEAFDQEYRDLREKLDERRRNPGPVGYVVRRMLGLGIKQRQYERGKAFFDAVATARGVNAASSVWAHPDNLPKWAEFDHPDRWIRRVDP